MKNLSITLLILSSLLFGTSAFAQSKNKQHKNKKATVKTTRTVKNVRPNRKVVKVKTVKVNKKSKYGKKYPGKGYKKNYNKRNKTPKYNRHNRKWKRHAKHVHSPRYLVGQRYDRLPRRAIRVVRHGRVQFYANNAFFRPVYKRGRTHFVVVF